MDNWETIGNEGNSISITEGGVSTIKEYSAVELWEQAWSKAGKALFYMQYIHRAVHFGSQKNRVDNMCYHLAVEHNSHYENTEENREWFRKWIKAFDDEVENMC